MVNFLKVVVLPDTGHVGRPWRRPRDLDSFVKSARRISELYSSFIAELGLLGKHSEMRINAEMARRSETQVRVVVATEGRGNFEIARIEVPRGVSQLDPQTRALLALEAVHGAVQRLGRARDWPSDCLEQAFRKCLEEELDFKWNGYWKSSPDRRLQARCEFRIEDHGFGSCRVVIRDSYTRHDIGVSDQELSAALIAGFKMYSKTMRWHDSGHLTFDHIGAQVPYEITTADVNLSTLSEPHAWPQRDPIMLDSPRPGVVVLGRGVDAPEQQHEIVFLGGGPSDDVPRGYLRGLHKGLERLVRRGESWWADSDLKILEIDYLIHGDTPRIALRRSHNRLRACIHRPLATLQVPNPAAIAHQDVRDLLAAVTQKEGLSSPPSLGWF